MSEILAAAAPVEARRPLVLTFIRESIPSPWEAAMASGSAILLIYWLILLWMHNRKFFLRI